VNVQSWACVSFSCLSLKEIIMVLSELRELMAPGMVKSSLFPLSASFK
jgi:hypothetical protein